MPEARKTILLVEDDPTSLKLTAKVLRAEGHVVHIASNAEQALTALSTLRPDLMLVDLQLPGMSGLELTRQVKQDAELNQITVVALTACTSQDTKQQAHEAGCSGYLTKPIDPRTLAMRVHEYLNGGRDDESTCTDTRPAAEPDPASSLVPESEMEEMRRSFLAEGATQSQQFLASLDLAFDANALGRVVHQWAGSAGLLGFARISDLAREVETLLRTPPFTVSQLRVPLSDLTGAFGGVDSVGEQDSLPGFLLRQLVGKAFALVGFGDVEAMRLCETLQRAGAIPRRFRADGPPDGLALYDCSLVLVHVCPETFGSRWLASEFPVPLVLAGERKHLLSLNPAVQLRALELLIDDWQPQEALMRLGFALARATASNLVFSAPGEAA